MIFAQASLQSFRIRLAVIEATEEAIYNSLFRTTTTSGRGHTVEALPIDKTLEILRKYHAL